MTADDVRATVPAALVVHQQTRETVLRSGQVPRELKELCWRYLAEDDAVMGFETDPGRSEAERAALAWTHAIAWDADRADDALWRRLHAHFSEPELVELGYAIAYVMGQMHWERTLRIAPDATNP
jgi:alkylhydroperoxidase family enzyme